MSAPSIIIVSQDTLYAALEILLAPIAANNSVWLLTGSYEYSLTVHPP